jgi:serine/threonine protein kinase
MYRHSEYAKLLAQKKLWPIDPEVEQDWSGRGQHAEFQKDEQKLINEVLEVQDNLGSTLTAIVQSVKCRRILLARKTITCGKQTMTKQEAIEEVSHLTRLNHAYILRVVGTYVKGRELSILLYPVAEYNLETFLAAFKISLSYEQWQQMWSSIVPMFWCLSNAVRYIHQELTKHMDIKPQNILLGRHRNSTSGYKIYIADFGIALAYHSADAMETDSRTSFTKRYAAPEVVKQDLRGRPADIFSLGCVYYELLATIHPTHILKLYEPQSEDARGTSYQASIPFLQGQLMRWEVEIRPLERTFLQLKRFTRYALQRAL